MYSLVSHFFPVSNHYLQCIHCFFHQTLEIYQLLTIYQGVHITYFTAGTHDIHMFLENGNNSHCVFMCFCIITHCVIMQKHMILTSKRHADHPFPGQNTQQTESITFISYFVVILFAAKVGPVNN